MPWLGSQRFAEEKRFMCKSLSAKFDFCVFVKKCNTAEEDSRYARLRTAFGNLHRRFTLKLIGFICPLHWGLSAASC